MKVRFRNLDLKVCQGREADYVSPTQLFLSGNVEYEVHALSVYDGILFLQVVDDKATPIFLPRCLFDVCDAAMPDDWICNAFPVGPIQLVVGPPYVAGSQEAYGAMLDQRAPQVESFWKRYDARSSRPKDDDGVDV